MRNTWRHLLRFLVFICIGLVIAGIGETQFSVFIRSDIPNLIGSIAFNTVYLILAGFVSWLVVRGLGDGWVTILLQVAIFGTTGLMIEWFLIGNSPWGNPLASQTGMFAFWSAMVVVPFVYLRPDPRLAPLKKRIFVAVLVYAYAAALIQLIPNPTVQFVYHIWSVILGYTALVLFTTVGYIRVVPDPDKARQEL
ncbi:MAG: hypothetical protein WD708_12605 [Kiritimatiellia bacterium]